MDNKHLNLDAMGEIELGELWGEIENHPRISAKKYGYTVKDINHLKNYAINKLTAMVQRKDGFILAAMKYEKICENIYSYLSNSAKW